MRKNDDLISRKALCEYALNQKDKSITPNDIMRFPSAQPKKRTEERTETHACDLISRQAAIDAFKPYADYESNRTNADWVRRIELVLHDLPSAQPQRTGRWIPTDNESFKRCSECGRHVYAYKYPNKAYPYCHCGAKMEDEGW